MKSALGSVVRVMSVMMVMVFGGGEGWAGKNQHQQDGGKNLFHGTTLACRRRRR
jgi:hypothetical protein